MTAIFLATFAAVTIAGCAPDGNPVPEAPTARAACTEWEWDGDQWKCDEPYGNGNRSVFFHNGNYGYNSIASAPGYSRPSYSSGVTTGTKASGYSAAVKAPTTSVKSGSFTSNSSSSGAKGGIGSSSSGSTS